MLNSVYRTIDLISILGIEDLHRICSWIDAAHAVYPNMRGHTGRACTFGTSIFCTISAKQKLNSGSSTESEVVGNRDFITKPISHGLFMEEKWYPLEENIACEDNMSTIKFLTNGRKSCGKRSRNVEMRHYFLKDFIDKGTIKMKHFPTELMLADFFQILCKGLYLGYSRI